MEGMGGAWVLVRAEPCVGGGGGSGADGGGGGIGADHGGGGDGGDGDDVSGALRVVPLALDDDALLPTATELMRGARDYLPASPSPAEAAAAPHQPLSPAASN